MPESLDRWLVPLEARQTPTTDGTAPSEGNQEDSTKETGTHFLNMLNFVKQEEAGTTH